MGWRQSAAKWGSNSAVMVNIKYERVSWRQGYMVWCDDGRLSVQPAGCKIKKMSNTLFFVCVALYVNTADSYPPHASFEFAMIATKSLTVRFTKEY